MSEARSVAASSPGAARTVKPEPMSEGREKMDE